MKTVSLRGIMWNKNVRCNTDGSTFSKVVPKTSEVNDVDSKVAEDLQNLPEDFRSLPETDLKLKTSTIRELSNHRKRPLIPKCTPGRTISSANSWACFTGECRPRAFIPMSL